MLKTLAAVRDSARRCEACPLFASATQTVFGEGPKRARMMLIGEQPGDEEDLEGRPFVGPAGRLLDEILEEAGVTRDEVYLTNVVKHFKWVHKGKRRLHQKPTAREIAACRPWLDAELSHVRPQAVMALGASPAQSLFGRDVRVTRDHGKKLPSLLAPVAMVSIHPSAVLRARDAASRMASRQLLVDDLRALARTCRSR